MTATLTPADATGKVTFYDGITILGTVSVTGQTATLDTIFLPAGNRSLRAYYAGDATYAPATSAIPAHVVNVRPSATFAPAAGSPIQAGFEPAGVAISDFNGDGKADIAIANFADSTVSVLLGTGTGTFSPANGSPLRSGTSPVSIGAADFNGDGNTDLAIVNYGSQDLTVLLGDGSGNFSEATGSPVIIGNSPLSLVIADFNRDGKADLAIVRDWDSSIAILLGDGLGGFTQTPESPLSMGGRFLTFSAADLNDDGNADLLVTNLANGTVSILLGNGSGGFTNAPGSPIAVVGGPAALVVADFNLDGRADFALATNVSGIWTSLGNGDASFVKKLTSVPPMVMPFAMSINDVNADGKPDVIAVDHNGGITALTGDAVGGLAVAPGSPIPVEAQPTNGVAFADFNGDGRADIVATVKSNSDVQVLLGRGLLSSVNLAAITNPVEYGQAVTLSATVEPSSATGSVVFYDGVTPLGSATVNNGTATLDVNSILSGRRALRAFYVGDVTYAGSASNVIIEAVNATPSTTLAAATAGPVATGSSGSPFGVGAGANSIATADFNLDGAPDLAVANSADNTVSLLFGNGQGGFTAAAGSPFAVGIAPQAVAIGDFNGDGRPDLVVIDAGESKITTLLNTGAGNMIAVSGRVLLAAGPYSTAVGDYDGDGIADLAVTSASNNGVSVFFGVGSGTF